MTDEPLFNRADIETTLRVLNWLANVTGEIAVDDVRELLVVEERMPGVAVVVTSGLKVTVQRDAE